MSADNEFQQAQVQSIDDDDKCT